jgi:hypothetical protein
MGEPAFASLLKEPVEKVDEIEIGPDADPMQFLRAIYLNKDLPLSQRMRAAIEMMPYMHPKLAVSALVQEGDFATLLEQRIKRFNEAKMVEHKPQVIESKPPMPRVADKRFRRI